MEFQMEENGIARMVHGLPDGGNSFATLAAWRGKIGIVFRSDSDPDSDPDPDSDSDLDTDFDGDFEGEHPASRTPNRRCAPPRTGSQNKHLRTVGASAMVVGFK